MRNYNYCYVRKVFKTQWFSIDEIPHNIITEQPYYSISCPDSVAILARTVDRRFILVSQFRPPQKQHTLELPSGYFDSSESHEAAARRELLEETGYLCEKLIYVGAFKLCPSRINNTIYAYCGIDARLVNDKRESDIAVILVPDPTLREYFVNGTYNEPTGIAAYYLSQEKNIFP